MTGRYSKKEVEFIKNNYLKMSLKEISAVMHHPQDSIRKRAYSLGLKKKYHRKWTSNEDRYIEKNYTNNVPLHKIAQKLNVNEKTLIKRIHSRRLRRDYSCDFKKFSCERIGYIAGLVDGEGTVTLHRGGTGTHAIRPFVGIVNTNKKMIYTLYEWFKEAGATPIIHYRPDSRKYNYRACYSVELSKVHQCLQLLKSLSPYLIDKKEKSKVVMQYCESRWKRFFKPYTKIELKLYDKIRLLNRKGVNHSFHNRPSADKK